MASNLSSTWKQRYGGERERERERARERERERERERHLPVWPRYTVQVLTARHVEDVALEACGMSISTGISVSSSICPGVARESGGEARSHETFETGARKHRIIEPGARERRVFADV